MPGRIRVGQDRSIIEGSADARVRIRWSGEVEIVDDRRLPVWFEQTVRRVGQPSMRWRVEIRGGRPELVAMRWWSEPGQREIKQKDLRSMTVAWIINEVYPLFVVAADQNEVTDEVAYRASAKTVERLRAELSGIPDTRLQEAAEIYKANIGGAPTKAVAQAFGVKWRMGATYVARARRDGYLPPTKRGKKHA